MCGLRSEGLMALRKPLLNALSAPSLICYNTLMIRITTGSAKNAKLKTPNIPGFRSVQEVAKSSLFSILADKVEKAVCLDLYSGSGNLGLEALSRDAAQCDFVDENKEAKITIQENIKKCQFEEKAEFHFRDSVKFATNTEKQYDLIFVDPFYDSTSHVFLMKNLDEILKPQGLISFFHAESLDMDNLIKDTNLEIIDKRKFGKSYFTILKKSQ